MHWCNADGIQEQGSSIMYKANVRKILTEGDGDNLKAVGVQLADGRTYKGQVQTICFTLPSSYLASIPVGQLWVKFQWL